MVYLPLVIEDGLHHLVVDATKRKRKGKGRRGEGNGRVRGLRDG